MHSRSTFCMVAGISLLLGGCGGGDESAPPPKTVAPPSAPPVSNIPISTGPSKNAGASQTIKTGGQKKPEPRAARPDVPPEMLFEVGADIPNLALLPRDQANPADVFVLVVPQPGTNSDTVTLIPPAGDGLSASPPSPTAARTLPAGFTPVLDAGYSDDGLPLRIRCDKDGALLALIRGGLFLQGQDGVDPDAGPTHPVELDPYYIDVTEVTLDQYRRFRSDQKPTPTRPGNDGGPPDHPVLGIPWRDALAYCRWAGRELPTEAQWERAARGPDHFVYAWGNDPRAIWSRGRTPRQIDAVGSFRTDRSPEGVFDLAGNAREWCTDFYAENAYQQATRTDGTAVANWAGPTRPSRTGHRVVRGNGPGWELWYRSSASMSENPPDVGFRGVLNLKAATAAPTGTDEPPTSATPEGAPRTGTPPRRNTPGRDRARGAPPAPFNF